MSDLNHWNKVIYGIVIQTISTVYLYIMAMWVADIYFLRFNSKYCPIKPLIPHYRWQGILPPSNMVWDWLFFYGSQEINEK